MNPVIANGYTSFTENQKKDHYVLNILVEHTFYCLNMYTFDKTFEWCYRPGRYPKQNHNINTTYSY